MAPRVLDQLGQRVLHGPGALDRLGAEAEVLGLERVCVLASASVARGTPAMTLVAAALGPRLAGQYIGIRAHTPAEDVRDAAETARSVRADGLLALGGGSVIDGAKNVKLELTGNLRSGDVRIIAVPTTLSGAEFTPLAGITVDGHKTGTQHPRLRPDTVLLDPTLASFTPRPLWATTGVRSLDHAIEGILTSHEPEVHRWCADAIRELHEALPPSVDDAYDVDAASRCQEASWRASAGLVLADAAVGPSHLLGKALGARYGIPHGLTSAITVPIVLRWLARPGHPGLQVVAAALGGTPAQDAADAVEAWLRRLGIERPPLSKYGVQSGEIPDLVERALGAADPDLVAALEAAT